jgi:hypothetical protein
MTAEQEELRRMLLLVAAGHPDAADWCDKMADQLRGLAARLRSGKPPEGTVSPGGVGDRVRMQVRGPGGELKHETES